MNKATWKRDFIVFVTTQTLSLLGSSLVQYAMMWYITLHTKSGVMMTLSIICGFVPTFILSPFAGVWADRYDRKKLIALADGMIALVTLGVALLFMAGKGSVWLLLGAMAFRAMGQAIQGPAVGAILPQIVPKEGLMKANGINGTIQSTILLVSPILSGLLLSLASLQAIFFIDVSTALLAIVTLLSFLKIPPHEKAARKQEVSYFADMGLGFAYIKRHPYLIGYFVWLGLFLFLVVPAAFLTPLQATRTFGPEVWRLTAIEVAFSGGMMLGGLLISTWGGFRNRMRTMMAAGLVMAACTLALALAPWFWLYLGFMALFGVAMPFFNTPSAVMIQDHVEGEYLGRVYSVMTMLSTSVMPLGMLLFGPLADLVKIEWLLLGTGIGMVVHAAVASRSKKLLEAGWPKPAPDSQGVAEPQETTR